MIIIRPIARINHLFPDRPLVQLDKKLAGADLKSVVNEYYRTFGQVPDETAKTALQEKLAQADQRGKAVAAVEAIDIDAKHSAEAFWFVRDLADERRPGARWTTATAFAIGIGLFAVIIVQNVWFVIRYTYDSIIR